MIITPDVEYPMVCISVKHGYQDNRLKLDLINMNTGASWFHSDELEEMDGTGRTVRRIFSIFALPNDNNLFLLFLSYCHTKKRKYQRNRYYAIGQRGNFNLLRKYVLRYVFFF